MRERMSMIAAWEKSCTKCSKVFGLLTLASTVYFRQIPINSTSIATPSFVCRLSKWPILTQNLIQFVGSSYNLWWYEKQMVDALIKKVGVKNEPYVGQGTLTP